jgi:hypothetical protein
MHTSRFVVALVTLALPACGGEGRADDGGSGSGGTAGTSGTSGTAGTGGVSGTGGTAGDAGSGGFETGPWIHGLAEGDGSIVATALEGVPDDPNVGRGVIFHSSDGLEWSRVATDLPFVPYAVAYGNGRFVALATRYERDFYSAAAYWSDDGITWTAADIPATQCGSRLAFGNGFFLGICDGGHLRSADGTSWENVGPAPEYASGGGVEFANGTFVSFPASATNVWVGDGDAFESVDATGDRLFFLAALRAVNDVFLGKSMYMCCAGEQPQLNRWSRLTSNDGSTWTHGEELSSEPPEIVFDDGTLCIGFLGMSVLTGATCDALDRTQPVSFPPVAAVKSGDRYFVAGGLYGESGIIASTDGATWTTVFSAEN